MSPRGCWWHGTALQGNVTTVRVGAQLPCGGPCAVPRRINKPCCKRWEDKMPSAAANIKGRSLQGWQLCEGARSRILRAPLPQRLALLLQMPVGSAELQAGRELGSAVSCQRGRGLPRPSNKPGLLVPPVGLLQHLSLAPKPPQGKLSGLLATRQGWGCATAPTLLPPGALAEEGSAFPNQCRYFTITQLYSSSTQFSQIK